MNLKLAAGLLACITLGSITQAAVVDITDDSIKVGETKSWTADNRYILHGKVCVENGARLNIAAGTVVCGDPSDGKDASVLIICRGGRIYAQGTADKPIIFTSVLDTAAWDSKHAQLPLTNDSRGLWGGFNVFGRAPVNIKGGVCTDVKDDETLTDSTKVYFGDSTNANPNDTSGVLEYISIRYTGITDKAQIKGLVFGGVGKGTKVDHIENVLSSEDGIGMRGGNVDVKYMISAFHAGDGLFAEMGYQGRVQYYFGIMNVVEGPAVNGCMTKIEHNGATNAPNTIPQMYNFTFIGTGINNPDTWKYKYGIYFKKDGAGTIANSILTQCSNYGVYVEDKGAAGTAGDSASCRARLDHDSLIIKNNIIYGFGHGNTIDSISMGLAFLQKYLTADSNHNTFADPQIAHFSWTREGKLDPRPAASGPATQNVAAVPKDGFFDSTGFKGAFEPGKSLWASGWSFLSNTGVFSSDATPVFKNQISSVNISNCNLLVTGTGITRIISWNQSKAADVTISLHSVDGKQIAVLSNGYTTAGKKNVTVSLKGIPSGLYVVHFKSGNQIETRLMGRI